MLKNTISSTLPRTVLVTGAAQGIGAAIATAMAKEKYNVALADLPRQELAAMQTIDQIKKVNPHSKCLFVGCDVSKRQDVFDAVNKTHERFGNFDVMVNNAGIASIKTLLETTEEDSYKVWSINVNSTLFGIQAAATKFIEQNTSGKIINACSIAGFTGLPALGMYSSSKFAVKSLTQTAAKELAKNNITVNAFCPGIVNTPMWDLIDSKLSEINKVPLGASKKAYIEGIALGRLEEPEDITGLISFLASDKSDYITGQSIIVDGGIFFS